MWLEFDVAVLFTEIVDYTLEFTDKASIMLGICEALTDLFDPFADLLT